MEKLQKNVREATSLSLKESSKHKTTKEFFKYTLDQVCFVLYIPRLYLNLRIYSSLFSWLQMLPRDK